MSGGLIRMQVASNVRGERAAESAQPYDAQQGGVGMLEFLVALLIFSSGMMGLLGAQLVGKKASFEASQRSVAVTLARDIVERMRVNPGQLDAYQVNGLGAESNQPQSPGADCDASVCSVAELAAFDIWQWGSLLRGASEQGAKGNAGGLLVPRACITSSHRQVTVTISWRAVLSDGPVLADRCSDESSDESGDEVLPDTGPIVRQQLTLSTFVARR